MTTDTAHPGDDPHRLLSNAGKLAQRVRKEQRATWFPLLVLAALTFASVPVRRYSGQPPWYFYPVVLPGSVLLLGGIGVALAQRSATCATTWN